MTSANYLDILCNAYDSQELTKDDFKNTAIHYARLYHSEFRTPDRTLDAIRKYQKELNDLQDMVTLFGSFTHEESARAIELKSKINQLLNL